jgi:ketosteroid isomerase-like protein
MDESSKALATEFFARFDANDVAGALELLADDATWWMAGKPDVLPGAGSRTKAEMARVFRDMTRRLKHGLRMTVLSSIAEGDRVALEVVSHGELENGRVYDNEYHFLVTVRDGKIRAVREYYDTQHVAATWFAP